MATSTSRRVRAIVRVRPPANDNTDEDSVLRIEFDPKQSRSAPHLCLQSKDGRSWKGLKFHAVCDERSTQADVFCHLQQVVEGAADGVSATILAYGQTGTGKTFTMFGEGCDNDDDVSGEKATGVIPRSVHALFDRLNALKANDGSITYSVNCSFLQIYNDSVHDLLAPGNARKGLPIREDVNAMGGVDIAGLSSFAIKSPTAALKLLKRGSARRIIRETSLNERSSRSHAIYRLAVTTHSDDGTTRRAVLNLVDLAGSERWGDAERNQFSAQELVRINRSLSALGNCVSALVQRNAHIPFRDSSLTRILADCLGGGAIAVVLATVTGDPDSRFETASTLAFASRALALSRVVPEIRVEERVDDAVLLRRAKKEIQQLKETIASSSYEHQVGGDDAASKVKNAAETIRGLIEAIEEGTISPGEVGEELNAFFSLSRQLRDTAGFDSDSSSIDAATMEGGEDTSERPSSVASTASATVPSQPLALNGDQVSSDPIAVPAYSHNAALPKETRSPDVTKKVETSMIALAEAKHEELCFSFEDIDLGAETSFVPPSSKTEVCKRHDLEDCFLCRAEKHEKRRPSSSSTRRLDTKTNSIRNRQTRSKINISSTNARPRWTHGKGTSPSIAASNTTTGAGSKRRETQGRGKARSIRSLTQPGPIQSRSQLSSSVGPGRATGNYTRKQMGTRPSSRQISSSSARANKTRCSYDGDIHSSNQKRGGMSSSMSPTAQAASMQAAKDRARDAIAEASRMLAKM